MRYRDPWEEFGKELLGMLQFTAMVLSALVLVEIAINSGTL